MQDQYAGEAGTFVVDPELGIRIPLEQYQAEQAAKAAAAKVSVAKTTKSPINETV
ncbi:hypothetical protein [Methylobacter sp. S3L5C]|uniref:hypothetical protein n=1 Tax=Methylobacter sp. S3L5C TaxID=2839024 RepID=UPI001FAE2080|nr:hypothetical protein [Methylobacter sp. S3L5C]UOA07776.1 hypothetical protein KKZ03_16185 [Methylobacter sp. S3L5C]